MLQNSSADSEINIPQMVDHSVIDSISTGLKHRREELEIIKLEKEIEAQDIERITDLLNRYKQTCTDSTLDEKARVLFKSAYMKILIECQNSTKTEQALASMDTSSPELCVADSTESVTPNRTEQIQKLSHVIRTLCGLVQGGGEGGADNTTTTTTTSTQNLNKKAAAATTRKLDKTTTTTEEKDLKIISELRAEAVRLLWQVRRAKMCTLLEHLQDTTSSRVT